MNSYPADDGDTMHATHPAAMINKNSGERSAAMFVRKQLIACLGEDNVFDLFPTPGQPPAIEEAKRFLTEHRPDMVIVAGGDGTVSLSMDITDTLRKEGKIGKYDCPVAVLPMGTGNDLSRSLGFGGGYTKPAMKAEKKFKELVERMKGARQTLIDRFRLDLYIAPAANSSSEDEGEWGDGADGEDNFSHRETSSARCGRGKAGGRGDAHSAVANPMAPSCGPRNGRKVFTKNLLNYFSVGFDADIAANFSEFRDRHPRMCSSRFANKMWYGCFGCQAMCCSSPFPKSRVSLRIDGEKIKVTSRAEAIVVSNMLTYAGGSILWRDEKNKYPAPAVSDRKAEVCILDGVMHIVGVGTKTRSARKMGQGSKIRICVPADYVMQYDGEPVPPVGRSTEDCVIYITHCGQSLGMVLPKELHDRQTAEEDS